jgi:hypothetical protein
MQVLNGKPEDEGARREPNCSHYHRWPDNILQNPQSPIQQENVNVQADKLSRTTSLHCIGPVRIRLPSMPDAARMALGAVFTPDST